MAGDLGDYLERWFSAELDEVYRMTRLRDREHGFMVSGRPGTTTTDSGVQMGSPESISMGTPPARAVLSFDVHSHPVPGSVALSSADWDRFLADYAQYPPDMDFPDDGIRGMAVVNRRHGNDDPEEYVVHTVELRDHALRMSVEDQTALVQDAYDVMNGQPMNMVRTSHLRDVIEPFVREDFIERRL